MTSRRWKSAGMKVAMSICYEDSYPTILHAATRDAGILANVTNDAWFGRSGARYQHLQIARLRAIEGRRFLVRAANDGVSAIIGPSGALVAQAAEFSPAVLRGHVQPRSGTTPYLVAGNFPVIGAAAALLRDNAPGPLDLAPPEYHFSHLGRPPGDRSRNLRRLCPCLSADRVSLRICHMSLDRATIKYVIVACSGLILSACSRTAATAVPPVTAAPAPATVAAAAPLVTGLPDFTALVDHYGPAVVNVQVTERRTPAQTRTPQASIPMIRSTSSSAASASRIRMRRAHRVAMRRRHGARVPVSS